MCKLGFETLGFAEETLGTLKRSAGMMGIVERVLVPMGWKLESRREAAQVGSEEWERNFRIGREVEG